MPSLRCLLLASGLLALPRPGAAQPASGGHREMRLSWVRSASASSCPDAGHVEADVEQRLGWSPFVRPNAASESIEAAVTRDNDVWHAAIELRAPDGSSLGSREVESPAATCASLAAAAGLAIALMIEPMLPGKPPPLSTPAAPPLASPRGMPVPAPDSAPAAANQASSSVAAQGDMALGAVAVANVLPRVALGATVIGSTRLVQRWFVAVSASWLPEQHTRRGGADVGFGMTLSSIGPCYRIPIHALLSVSSCVSLLLGSLQITVTNPEPVAPGARLWWAASTGLRLDWSAGPFEAALGVDALARIARHSYLIDRSEPRSSASVFVEPAVALVGSLVAGVRY